MAPGLAANLAAGLALGLAAWLGLADTLAGTLAGTPAAAQSASPPAARTAAGSATTIIVLDGSNSMNGRLENDDVKKFVTARNALSEALRSRTPGTSIGLAAFGSQRSRDCTDAEMLVEPSEDSAPVLEALEEFEPGGFSPVAKALRVAADAMPKGTKKASIVVLLDDLASCRSENPCDIASELKSANPALTIHVVGLGLKESEAEIMACVAAKTGGKLFDASGPEAAAKAIGDAIRLANAEPIAKLIARPRLIPHSGTLASGDTPPADVLFPGLNLSARLADGQNRITEAVHWRIWKGEAGPTKQVLASAYSPTFHIKAEPGSYVIEVRAGMVTKRRTIAVTSSDPIAVPVTLDAGMIALSAPLSAGGATSVTTFLAVERANAKSSGSKNGGPLWISQTGAHNLIVPPGSYRVSASAGLVRAERAITVAAGKRQVAEIALNAGRLVVDTRSARSAQNADKIHLLVEADDLDSPTARREVARTAAPWLDLILPAGAYRVTARRGTAEAFERVLVRAGAATTKAFALNAASVRLVSRIGTAAPAGLPVSYRIERIDGIPRVISLSGKPEPTVTLMPGRYRVESRIGRQNAIAVGEAEVKAGAALVMEFKASAGAYQLKLAKSSGHGLGEVFWQVLDEKGQAVWRTSRPEPLVALAAGRYLIRVDIGGRTLESSLEAKAGERRTVEVGG